MKYQISKEFSFEAAHRLLRNYKGKCTNCHGHSFKVKLYLEGSKLDDKDMVIDFNETKALKDWVNDCFDHVTVLWEKDPLVNLLRETGNKVFTTKNNPTSEHIAEIIFHKAEEMFNNSDVKVYCLEINETCTTGAKVFA